MFVLLILSRYFSCLLGQIFLFIDINLRVKNPDQNEGLTDHFCVFYLDMNFWKTLPAEHTGVWGERFFAWLCGLIMEWVIQPCGKCSTRRNTQSAIMPAFRTDYRHSAELESLWNQCKEDVAIYIKAVVAQHDDWWKLRLCADMWENKDFCRRRYACTWMCERPPRHPQLFCVALTWSVGGFKISGPFLLLGLRCARWGLGVKWLKEPTPHLCVLPVGPRLYWRTSVMAAVSCNRIQLDWWCSVQTLWVSHRWCEKSAFRC